jgi:hypothetical protein
VVKALQKAARLTAIGVDYAEYLRLQSLTRSRDDFMNGRRTYRAPTAYSPTEEHIAFCMQFVVMAALRLSAAEVQLAKPPWIDETNRRGRRHGRPLRRLPASRRQRHSATRRPG